MKKASLFLSTLLLAFAANSHASVIAVEETAFAGATVIDFDNLPAYTSLGNQYVAKGVADFNAIVAGAQGYAETDSYIAGYSGSNSVWMGASIRLVSAVDRVGVWLYKFNGPQYLNALDASMNVLMTVALNSDSTDSANYDFVGIKSSVANIAYVVIANDNLSLNPVWDIGGNTTFFDNLTIGGASAVPEPASMALFGLGLLGAAAARRKKARAA